MRMEGFMAPIWNVLAGLGGALIPGITDWISGASGKRKKARASYLSELDRQAAELSADIGKSATTSTAFKTSKSLLDQRFNEEGKKVDQGALASGATPEAVLGAKENLNESYNRGILGALGAAEQERQLLKRMRNDLLLERYGAELGLTEQALGAQQQYAGTFAQMIPYLFDDLINKPRSGDDKDYMSTAVNRDLYGLG